MHPMCCAILLLLSGTAVAQSLPTPPRPPLPAYQNAADAKTHCGHDPVVWADSARRLTYSEHSQWYGKSKQGFYACRSAATEAGYHAAKD